MARSQALVLLGRPEQMPTQLHFTLEPRAASLGAEIEAEADLDLDIEIDEAIAAELFEAIEMLTEEDSLLSDGGEETWLPAVALDETELANLQAAFGELADRETAQPPATPVEAPPPVLTLAT
ncbi:MAG: hypothetical protein HC890_17355, partial [Chloroflexaceae bacterium]|nr:hypothetical protein [Chloroflexaceae bacterium]